MNEKKDIMVSDLSYDQREVDAVVSVLKSEWLTMGPRTNEFEKRLASYLGSDYAVAVSSGTAALHLGLLALGIQPGDEVIVTPLSFVASANVILYVGARPVFADIDPETFNMDPSCVASLVSDRTKAILPVHFAGLPAEMDELTQIASDYDIDILADAAHAIGAEYRGRKIGSIGKVTAFSFFSNKNLSVGEGGAITTCDENTASELKLMRSHGLTKSTWSRHHNRNEESFDQLYDMYTLGYNYRMTEIAAAIGCVQLEKIDNFNSRRESLHHLYADLLCDVPVEMQKVPNYVKHSHHILPVLLPPGTRASVRAKLQVKGIGTSIHYTPIFKFRYYRDIGYSGVSLPNSEDVGKRTLTLPLHQKLDDDDVRRVVEELGKALDS